MPIKNRVGKVWGQYAVGCRVRKESREYELLKVGWAFILQEDKSMNIDNLKAGGIDYDEGIKRFSGHDAIYQKYLKRIPGMDLFEELNETIEREEWRAAFECCHKLKAFVGNVSIPLLYRQVCELTDLLRMEQVDKAAAEAMLKQVNESYHAVAAVIKEEFL